MDLLDYIKEEDGLSRSSIGFEKFITEAKRQKNRTTWSLAKRQHFVKL